MDKEIEVKVYKLEDGLEYAVLDEINNYVYLSNLENPEDVCIRKDLGTELVGLDDEAEFNNALSLFKEKFI